MAVLTGYLMLTENGFGIVWLLHEVVCEMLFVAEFKDRLIPAINETGIRKSKVMINIDGVFSRHIRCRKISYIYFNEAIRDALTRFRLMVCGLRVLCCL